MSHRTRKPGAGALLALAVLAFCTPNVLAQAGQIVIPGGISPLQQRLIQRDQIIANRMAINPWANQAAALARYNAALLANTGYNPLYNAYSNGIGAYAAGFPAYPSAIAASPVLSAASTMTSAASPYALSGGGSSLTSVPGAEAYNQPYTPSSYSPYSVEDPVAGYLRGAAQVFNAQGQYQIQRAQGRIMTEQWKQAQQETRRRIHEEWLWERANTPTLQDILEQEQVQRERNALRTPAITDIWSGNTLNTLLNIAQKKPSANAPSIPLSEDVVKRLNIVPGRSNYSLAAVKQLKDGVSLSWPLELSTSQYEPQVKVIDKLLPQAVQSAYSTGKVESRDLLEMRAALSRLYDRLETNANDLGPNQYIPAKRYLNQLDDALKALQQDNVDRFFNKLGNVRSVADLVKEMSTKGLTFGPAGSGDEAAYLAIQQALAAYDAASQTSDK